MSYIFENDHEVNDGIEEVSCDQVNQNISDLILIDVRSDEEYSGELGHIKNSRLVTLGDPLAQLLEDESLKDKEIVFICRSGRRSAAATKASRQKGFKASYNMIGGMIEWNEKGFLTES